MSKSSQSSEHSSKDPVRIVYHAGNRTFARLFNERSLEEVKDVVRRKLGLGPESTVSLKQMIGSGALLDLEDDGDFQAFRVLLRSCVSVDIQVTVGRPQGSIVLPQPPGKPSVSEPTTTLLASSSRDPAGVAASDQPRAPLKVARTVEASTTTPKRAESSARKRKVSFGDALVGSDKLAEQHAPTTPAAASPVASTKTAESPAASKAVGEEVSLPKKRKKEPTKTKDVETTEVVESPATKPSGAPKPKPKRSMALSKAVPKDDETSEPPAKKQRKQKKDVSPGRKSSAPIDQDGSDQPVSQPSIPVNEASPQPAAAKPTGSGAEDGTSKIRKTRPPRGTVCASIPRTSASTNVLSEVAAAILSGYLSKASETIPPEPPAQPNPVKRVTEKSSAPSSALPAELMTVLDAPVSGTSNAPTPLQQTLDLNGPPCPICMEEPFHIRYCCPTVLKGPDAIRERLEELQRTNMGDQQSLIKQLEGLLRDSKVTSEPSFDTVPTNDVQSRVASPPPSPSLPRTPNIPTNSYLSEVTVESRDEGSSSESSDDMLEGGVEHQDLSAPRRQKAPDKRPSLSNVDLEAVIRGPASKGQSVLHLLDRIVGDEDEDEDEDEEDEAQLEEDPDEETGQSRRWSSRHITRSSDSKSEEEESRSPSPSCSAEDTPNNRAPGFQASNKPVEESAEHQGGDVVSRYSVDPPVLQGQDDDSSEETHVGSEDRVAVDESIGEKGAAATVEEQPASPASSNEPQESGQTEVDLIPNRDGNIPVASEVPKEVGADPIEPADDLESPTAPRSSNADPIEAPSEDIGSLFTSVTQSGPTPGVSKRIKTRSGRIPVDEADRPVLLEQLATVAMDEATPIAAKGRSGRKVMETPASQEPAPTRKSPRFSSLPPSTSTPVAVVLMNHKAKAGARSGKATKTPAKRSEERPDASQSLARIAPTPSLVAWETLAEPSSPSLQQDEPSVLLDELLSSSPQADYTPIHGHLNNKGKKGRTRKPATSSQAESWGGKARISSLLPLPHSQNRTNPAPTALPNGKEGEEATDSEEEPKVVKKMARMSAGYRPLSQLASHAALFSPSLPTPANKSVANGKAKKRPADDDSSSSSSSDADEANGSEHIPKGRRAGSALKTKKKIRLSRS